MKAGRYGLIAGRLRVMVACVIVFYGCDKHGEGSAAEKNGGARRIDTKQKTQLVADWQSFRTNASTKLTLASARICQLEKESEQHNMKESRQCRKLIQTLRKEQIALHDNLIYKSFLFGARVEKATPADMADTKSFQISFHARLEQLVTKIDRAFESCGGRMDQPGKGG